MLEARARHYTFPYRDVVRAKIVLLAAEGLENKAIGERLDLPRPVVSKWRRRFFRERLAGLEDRSRLRRYVLAAGIVAEISRSPSPSRGSSRAEIRTASWIAEPPLSSRNPLSPHDNPSSNV